MTPGFTVSGAFASLLIPTVDSTRNEYTMGLSIQQLRSVLFIGGPGTAKTSTVLQYLGRQDKNVFMVKKMSFSSATTPTIFQRQIENSVEKRSGKNFGPPGNKKMLVFIDDISMPAYNDWGDQITMEIVRQLMEYKGMYNLDKPGEFKNILDLIFIGAMLQPGGGKNDISCMAGMNGGRCKRQFHVMNVTLPSVASINQIFGALLRAQFHPDSENKVQDVWDVSEMLVDMTISVWEAVKKKMLPTPAKFHYIFNLRDLSRIFQGVFMCDSDAAKCAKYGYTLKTDIMLLGLWKHECERVFADRLVDSVDKGWFDKTINKLLEDQFGPSKAGALKDSMFFVDFLRDGDEDPETGEELAPPQIYEPVDSLVSCRERVKMFCGRFNDLYKLNAVDMVLFDDALMHFMRIYRIMRTPRARLSAARGRGRFGQANPHAPWSIRGRLHLLPVHHHEAVQLAEPDGRLQAALYAGGHQEQGRGLHLHRQGDQRGGLPRVHQHLPQYGRVAQPLRARRARWHLRRGVRRVRKVAPGQARGGPLAGRPLCVLHQPRARQLAHRALLLTRRPEVAAAHPKVPRPHQRLHRRLVPPVARGGPHGGRAPLYGQVQHPG
jgi:hypothetical protein